MMRTLRTFGIAAACGLLAAALVFSTFGCRDGIVRTEIPVSLDALNQQGALGPLDVVDVRVFDEPELSGEYRIDADGTLTFPFLGAVTMSGLTPNEAAGTLTDGLAEGYLVQPVVSVFVKEVNSRRVFVLGKVQDPGAFPFSDGMTLVEAIAMAGGEEDGGALKRTKLARKVDGQEVKFTVDVNRITNGDAPDVELMPSDIIFVPSSAI